MEPLAPLPPVSLPVSDPSIVPHPAPRMPMSNWQEKPVWKSRTILSLVVAVVAIVLGFFGIEGIDVKAIADDNMVTLGELVTLVFAIAAAWFRIDATGPLKKPKQTAG